MQTNEIRKRFLNFFAAKGHTIVESDSLVPKNDPTVLFTTAGMQQFKRQFLGHLDGYSRAASSQKCLRTDDLDHVGKTAYHHTFFEMLGNFSFGDYFKKEAIEWAWEFLTTALKIPAEKLWVSVYKDDAQAKKIWLEVIKIPASKIASIGDKSNFWPSNAKENGPNGPCGPCSEIFYDYGLNPACQSKICDPGCDCGRFCEVWNLVFTQYNRKDGGVLEPLPNKNIDTGMGLERLASVMQGKKNNFETDIFEPILKAIQKNILSQTNLISSETFIIADHIRAICFGIADGVVPSNEERGYVIKKLIIDSTDIALKNGLNEPIIYKLVPALVEAMKEPYPDLIKKETAIAEIIKRVEESYIKLRNIKIPELVEEIEACVTLKTPAAEMLGNIFFKYHDTHGLSIESILKTATGIIETLQESVSKPLRESALLVYEKEMKKQQERSRASSKILSDVFTDTGLKLDGPKTTFLGYEKTECPSKILKIFIEKQPALEAREGQRIEVILDQTPFYAASGGQISDTGVIEKDTALVIVEDTQRIDDIFIHSGRVEKGVIKAGDTLTAKIDENRRLAIMRNHTATHLLQAALREILGKHVQQQGSLVDKERLRFDFTHPKALTPLQILEIEQKVYGFILNCDPVQKEYLSLEKASETGALAFFAEKYGSIVRVISIGGYSKEFCGGTHLNYTGEIGFFKIVNESAIAQGIRRLEAVTGLKAYELVINQEKKQQELARILKVPVKDLVERFTLLINRCKELEKEIRKYRLEAIKGSIETIIAKGENFNDLKIITHLFDDIDMSLLRTVADLIKQKLKNAIIVLASRTKEDAALLVSVGDQAIKAGFKANEIIKDLAPLIQGQGGGSEHLAQAGGKDTTQLASAIAKAAEIIKKN